MEFGLLEIEAIWFAIGSSALVLLNLGQLCNFQHVSLVWLHVTIKFALLVRGQIAIIERSKRLICLGEKEGLC